jgi:hypothetical protein
VTDKEKSELACIETVSHSTTFRKHAVFTYSNIDENNSKNSNQPFKLNFST